MTVFATDSTQLNYRVAGVCVHGGHVLLHREEQDGFWVLPGGRPLLFEASPDTLVREMEEEIAARIDAVRLRPTFLRTALKAIPDSPVHVIHVDAPDESAVYPKPRQP